MAIVFGSDIGIVETPTNLIKDMFKSAIADTLGDISSKYGFSNGVTLKENVYVDDGFTNVPGTAFKGSNLSGVDDIQKRRITTQQPALTIYVKKRAFWALRAENDIKYMDASEKLFLRATKLLFEKKCSQLAAYEAMTKLQSIVNEETDFDADMANKIVGYVRSVADEQGQTVEQLGWSNIISGLEEIAKKSTATRTNTQTTWVVHPDFPDLHNVGRGSGVIELTSVTSVMTDLGIDGSSSFNFTMEDPYNLTKVSANDIEMAMSTAIGETVLLQQLEEQGSGQSHSLFRGPQFHLDVSKRKDAELKRLRRGGSVGSLLGDEFAASQNTALASLGSPEIVFEVNTSSSAQNKVTGSVTSIPATFTKSTYGIILAQLPLEHQLSSKEQKLLEDIFDSLELYVSELERLNFASLEANKTHDVTQARVNMRKHYLGKSIIQPMDTVHVYIRGNTTGDGEIVGPLGALLNETQFVKKFAGNGNRIFPTVSKISDVMLEEEMKMLKIEGVPVEFYKAMRSSSLLRNAGSHVFAGLVSTVSESYSAENGSYTTSVSGESNIRWLKLSRINKTPSLDQTQGLLEDPLTYFDIEVDAGTGLVKPDPKLSRVNKETRDRLKLLHNRDGGNKGKPASDETTTHDYVDNGDGGPAQKVDKHIPGFVYKWKQGVIAASRNVNLQTALDGTENQTAKLRRDMGITVVQDPFAGLDAADIVSLLVTGSPHNYETFFKHSRDIGTISKLGDNSPLSYFGSFFDIVKSQNRAMGNFQPVKLVNSSPKQINDRLLKQLSLKDSSNKLNELRRQLANVRDQRYSIKRTFVDENNTAESSRLQNIFQEIEANISDQIFKAEEEWGKNKDTIQEFGLKMYGNDIAFELVNDYSKNESNKNKIAELRLRNTLMQIRPQFECKFNLDDNLFIIGDEYDKDLDIQAYVVASISSQKVDLWNSTFKNPYEICNEVAGTIDFEFFADSQGHIQFRPPRYNKVPLSLILKMFLLNQNEGKKIYPEFIETLFKSKRESYREELEIVDLDITVESILLGVQFASDNASNSYKRIEDTNSFAGTSEGVEFSGIENALVSSLLDAKQKLANADGSGNFDKSSAEERKKARKEINTLNNPNNPNMNINRISHSNRVSQLLSRRQRLAEIVAKLDSQGKKVDKNEFLSSSEEILPIFENLIEDDFNDFLGPGSSKRYIINDDQILSYDFNESDAKVFSTVEVLGQQDYLGESAGVIGGVPILWAGATDFDLWRQYGFKKAPSVSKPFLKNAESQCAPYALMLLSRFRKDVLTGSVKLIGNEYYQLGDVVYINSRDMLFYVTKVVHNFSYSSGSFTTTLELRYGHPLGEYIPTPLDVIGKGIIKNNIAANRTRTSRNNTNAISGIHLGAIKFSSKAQDSDTEEQQAMLSGAHAYHNVEMLKTALTRASLKIGKNDEKKYPKVEIRGFATDDGKKSLTKVRQRMSAVRKWLEAPTGRFIAKSKDYIKISEKDFVSKKMQPEQISKHNTVVVIKEGKDLSDSDASRLPSQEVYALTSTDGGKPDNVIEIVLIEQEIK